MGHMSSSLKGPILPSEAEARMAAERSRKIAARLGEGATLKLQVEGKKGEAEPLPPIAVRLVLDLLEELARGNAVQHVTAIEAELGTQQAADLLDILSTPRSSCCSTRAKLPYRHIGTRRRIPLEAVLVYKAEAYAKRKAALDEMSALHQRLGLELSA